jgi:hypothetical protein
MKFELDPYNRGMPAAALLDDLRGVALKLGKKYVTKDEYNENGRWCASTLQKRFGSWCKAHEVAGLDKVRNYDATAEDCVADIQNVAKRLGKTTLTTSEYSCHGKFCAVLISRRCGSWEAAIERAGLTASPFYHKRTTDEQLLENLENLWEALGRQPGRPDFVKPLSRHSYVVYQRRFGSFRKALEAFVASFESREPERFAEPVKPPTADSPRTPTPKRHKTSRTISWRLRFLVMRRDGFRCQFCGDSPATTPNVRLDIDHIIPWAEGGETVIENLKTLCERCNGGKSNLPMAPK